MRGKPFGSRCNESSPGNIHHSYMHYICPRQDRDINVFPRHTFDDDAQSPPREDVDPGEIIVINRISNFNSHIPPKCQDLRNYGFVLESDVSMRPQAWNWLIYYSARSLATDRSSTRIGYDNITSAYLTIGSTIGRIDNYSVNTSVWVRLGT